MKVGKVDLAFLKSQILRQHRHLLIVLTLEPIHQIQQNYDAAMLRLQHTVVSLPHLIEIPKFIIS